MESCTGKQVNNMLRGMRDMAGAFISISINMRATVCFTAFLTQPLAPIGFETRNPFRTDQPSLRGMRGIAYLFYTYMENCHR